MSELADKVGTPTGNDCDDNSASVIYRVLFYHAAIVGHCDLSSPDVEDILQRHSEHKRMRGIRQTLNYSEDHPEYCAARHDNYLTDPNWIRGFSLLEKYNLSFELLVLPRQMSRCVYEANRSSALEVRVRTPYQLFIIHCTALFGSLVYGVCVFCATEQRQW